MDSMRIGEDSLDGILEFLDRDPDHSAEPLQAFSVRVVCLGLDATVQVWAGYAPNWPLPFFEGMAERWKGWPGELTWASSEAEVILRSEQDKAGHVSIRVELRTGWGDTDWSAAATVRTEAGQLERISRQARAFFGRPPGDA